MYGLYMVLSCGKVRCLLVDPWDQGQYTGSARLDTKNRLQILRTLHPALNDTLKVTKHFREIKLKLN